MLLDHPGDAHLGEEIAVLGGRDVEPSGHPLQEGVFFVEHSAVGGGDEVRSLEEKAPGHGVELWFDLAKEVVELQTAGTHVVDRLSNFGPTQGRAEESRERPLHAVDLSLGHLSVAQGHQHHQGERGTSRGQIDDGFDHDMILVRVASNARNKTLLVGGHRTLGIETDG